MNWSASIILTVFVLLVCAGGAWASVLCDDQPAKDLALQKGVVLSAFDWAKVRTPIVLLGDSHGEIDLDVLTTSLAQLRGPRNVKSCLYLEFPRSINRRDLEKLLHAVPSGMSEYFLRILAQADDLDFKVKMVNLAVKPGQPEPRDSAQTTAMASRIVKLMNEGVCKTGVLLAGAAHIAADYTWNFSLRSLLRKSNVQHLAIYFVNSRINIAADERSRSWAEECSNAKENFAYKLPLILSTKSISNKLLWPNYSGLAKFGDFDYLILFEK